MNGKGTNKNDQKFTRDEKGKQKIVYSKRKKNKRNNSLKQKNGNQADLLSLIVKKEQKEHFKAFFYDTNNKENTRNFSQETKAQIKEYMSELDMSLKIRLYQEYKKHLDNVKDEPERVIKNSNGEKVVVSTFAGTGAFVARKNFLIDIRGELDIEHYNEAYRKAGIGNFSSTFNELRDNQVTNLNEQKTANDLIDGMHSSVEKLSPDKKTIYHMGNAKFQQLLDVGIDIDKVETSCILNTINDYKGKWQLSSGVLVQGAEILGERNNQEDSCYVGVGFIGESNKVPDKLRNFLKKQHKVLKDEKSGTTAVIAHLSPDRKLTLANIGDSRAVLVVKDDETPTLTRLTTDHNPRYGVEQEKRSKYDRLEYGKFCSERDIKPTSKPNVSRAACGNYSRLCSTPDIYQVDLNDKKYQGKELTVLLSCDGLYEGQLEENSYQKCFESDLDNPAEACVATAYANGSGDNITAFTFTVPSEKKKIKEPMMVSVFDGHGGNYAAQHCALRLEKKVRRAQKLDTAIPRDNDAASYYILQKIGYRGRHEEDISSALQNIMEHHYGNYHRLNEIERYAIIEDISRKLSDENNDIFHFSKSKKRLSLNGNWHEQLKAHHRKAHHRKEDDGKEDDGKDFNTKLSEVFTLDAPFINRCIERDRFIPDTKDPTILKLELEDTVFYTLLERGDKKNMKLYLNALGEKYPKKQSEGEEKFFNNLAKGHQKMMGREKNDIFPPLGTIIQAYVANSDKSNSPLQTACAYEGFVETLAPLLEREIDQCNIPIYGRFLFRNAQNEKGKKQSINFIKKKGFFDEGKFNLLQKLQLYKQCPDMFYSDVYPERHTEYLKLVEKTSNQTPQQTVQLLFNALNDQDKKGLSNLLSKWRKENPTSFKQFLIRQKYAGNIVSEVENYKLQQGSRLQRFGKRVKRCTENSKMQRWQEEHQIDNRNKVRYNWKGNCRAR